MDLIKQMTSSKKFWYAIGTLFILFFSESFGINDQQVNSIILIALALLVSQGIADCKGCKR